MFRSRSANIETEAETFGAYLSYWLDGPETKAADGESLSDYGSPYVHRLVASLTSGLHMSVSDALDVPVRTANNLLAALGEMRGTVKLWSRADQEFWEYAERMDRAAAKDS